MMAATPTNHILTSPRASTRLAAAVRWLSQRREDEEVLIVGASLEAADRIARRAMRLRPAVFGWHRTSLAMLAADIARPILAERELVPASPLPLAALCALVIHENRDALGRFSRVAGRPGLARALGETFANLRLADVSPADLPSSVDDLRPLYASYIDLMGRHALADRAELTRTAARGAQKYAGFPLLLLDVSLGSPLEAQLAASLAAGSPGTLATVQTGDTRTLSFLEGALGVRAVESIGGTRLALSDTGDGLSLVQRHLFASGEPTQRAADDSVIVMSAPGVSRECVEIARGILREADSGVRFDRMAVLLHAPGQYRAPLREALQRAGIPSHFDVGAKLPDPTGRAFLALLACAAEGLPASRFAEYLSLGEVPDAGLDGAPPAAPPLTSTWVPAEGEWLARPLRDAAGEQRDREAGTADDPDVDPDAPVIDGTLRAPRRWEQLLVDAAVIGGQARWKRRLDGLRNELQRDLERSSPGETRQVGLQRQLDSLDALRRFALPLLDLLANLPEGRAPWRDWLAHLSTLAWRAIRRPSRVLRVLHELAPMADVPLDLEDVRLVLGRRLLELPLRPEGASHGRVLVTPVEEARGRDFDVVFLPGLAERGFPRKIVEDPILLDRHRQALGQGLDTNPDRVERERLALRLAVGSATDRIVISYPRLDTERNRPLVPSFYCLEVLRIVDGRLLSLEELNRQAAARAAADRMGWPAPHRAEEAVDEGEYDLSLLAELSERSSDDAGGAARYLMDCNRHLARSLRGRFMQWSDKRWYPADGLNSPSPEAQTALTSHRLAARTYSVSALQSYAVCPYRFFLNAIHRVSRREVPEPIEQMSARQCGELFHDAQRGLLVALRAEDLLPLRSADAPRALEVLDHVVEAVAADHYEKLAPAIERVWKDGVADIRRDLRTWVTRLADSPWTPTYFELAFGLRPSDDADPKSSPEPVDLACGVRLRGRIDVVERRADGTVRVTDHKTGAVRFKQTAIIDGGKTLQPVFYALAAEALMPDARVEGGRLYYTTRAGGYAEREVPLNAPARRAAALVASTIDRDIEQGCLTANPEPDACQHCDYLAVCGPHAERKAAAKPRHNALNRLRGQP